jgi:hypothetical protein
MTSISHFPLSEKNSTMEIKENLVYPADQRKARVTRFGEFSQNGRFLGWGGGGGGGGVGSAAPCAFPPPPRAFIFSDYSFCVHHPLTRMTGNSLHMQWPLTSQLHGSFSQREHFFVMDQTPRPMGYC